MAAEASIREGLSLLRRPDFARLFAAYLITYTGTAMAPIAMAFGVLELTGSASDAAIVIAAPIAAQIVVILIGGALADRTSRQRVIVGAAVLAACSQATIAVLFFTGYATVPLLTGLMLVNGIAAAFNTPATVGFVPQMVESEKLQAANALLGIARNTAVAAGAALGGALVAFFGAGVTLAIDAASFIVAALLVLSLSPRRQVPPAPASLLHDLRLGWREFTSHTWLWTIVLQFSLVVAGFHATMGLLGPAVARDFMGGAVDWGFIASGMGFGTLVGGFVAIRVRFRRPMFYGTFCVLGLCLIPLALSVPLDLTVVVGAAMVGGLAGQIFGVVWGTTLQKMVAPAMLSRVSAYDHLGSFVLAPLGLVAGGVLYEALGARPTLLIAAATIVVPTICVLGVRGVRDLTADDVEARRLELAARRAPT